jgi:hypothetical protein
MKKYETILTEDSNMNSKGFEHFPDDCKPYISDPSHHKPGIHSLHDRLYVVTTVFNPLRFRSRYWNYWSFANMCEKAGAILYTAEIAFGQREFEVTQKDNPRHLQLRAGDNQEIWLKENSLNLLINRLPSDWQYVAWLDADISFARPDWAQETIQLLQHYDFLQLFSHAQDLGVNYEPGVTTPGFVYGKLTEEDINPSESIFEKYYYGLVKKGKEGKEWRYRHPGFCWAARRSALDKVGGLIDWTILGSGDFVMANALFGEVDKTINVGYTDNYKLLCRSWEDRALKHIRKNVGYMPGLVNHFHHGDKKARNYDNRWKLLVDTKFDPITDLKKDTQGLWQLQDDGTERFIRLRDGLRKYARLRQEDSTVGMIVP